MRQYGLAKMLSGVTLLVVLQLSAMAATPFRTPTPEELAMKAFPGYPGVSAVVLNREEITRDDLHMKERYDRIKILTDEGKKFANVELRYVSLSDFGEGDFTDDKKIGEITGRTIHADGSIVPFTGKPYRKTIEKGRSVTYQALVFTLPDVEVGSIIEYRYTTRINDNVYESPSWYIQGDLYVVAAHYEWYPTVHDLTDSKQRLINTISWFPILPPDAKLDHSMKTLPGGGSVNVYKLDVKDVPPTPEEEYQPPVNSYTYRVLFNFTSYRTGDEFWKSEGKDWSKRTDAFVNAGGLRAQTDKVTAGATTQAEKLHKIYAAVEAMENTRFTRERDKREDKAEGSGKMKTAADVMTHERGSPMQLTELFVGMARAAGMNAYAMLVPDRSLELFTPAWLSFEQFDDMVAIVNVDGKDIFFDPGWRYTPYGQLAWEHTIVSGMRQTESGTIFLRTPGEPASSNRTARIANLRMDDQGDVTGKIDMTFVGGSALAWRHTALKGDDESLKHSLQTSLEEMLPKSLEVKVGEISNLTAYEEPLKVSYTVTGKLGKAVGKRMLVPADLFLVGSSATFPHEKREQAVYFHFPNIVQDAVRVNFGKTFEAEATPAADKELLPERQSYEFKVTPDASGFTTRRNYVLAQVLVLVSGYDELRKFYTQFESKDQESVVLKAAPVVAAGAIE
jgi:hypothetical protein